MSKDTQKHLHSLQTNLEENATGAIYQVVKEFTARLDDELSLKLGDKVEVISDDKEYNDGWYMGKSLSTGQVGLYPKSFTQLVPSLSRPSLLRSRSRRIASPTSASAQSPLLLSSNNGTPVSKHSTNDYKNATPSENTLKTIKQSNEISNSHITGALSDIDKALEELKNDVQPRFEDMSFGNDSTESLNPEFVETWSPEQVTSYFKYLGFDGHSAEQFSKHKITGTILLELELAYLKELDISSFGTRFELFKEIEALKELAQSTANKTASHTFDEKDEILVESEKEGKSSQLLLSPPSLHKKDHGTAPLGLSLREAKSDKNTPTPVRSSQLFPPSKSKSSSIPSPKGDLPGGELFLSPRKAPQPPSFPSPLQTQSSSAQNTPVTNKRNSYYESVGHSRKPSYDINPTFQFRGNHSRKSSYEPMQHSRNNSRSAMHVKSASAADLLSTLPSEDGRPASSVYMDSLAHSRHSSVNLRVQRASRRGSDVSAMTASKEEKKHRRHSSVFSFLSGNMDSASPTKTPDVRNSSFFGNFKTPKSRTNSIIQSDEALLPTLDPRTYLSPNKGKRRSVSNKEAARTPKSNQLGPGIDQISPSPKRSVSEAFRSKTLRSISTSNAKKNKNKKEGTSAFMEGIRSTSPQDAIKTADCYGWMSKRGGIAVGVWKQRYFTLHGTRLSYFTSLTDKRERGLIDITSHKVLPARDDDKLVSLYAASTGHGKFCFKLVPPAPGSKKGLTFTQPKVHYFAVETKEEMRTWMSALIKATIDIDDSVPVLSSCATPTVSLQKAQNLLAQARENARKREETRNFENLGKPDISGSSSISPDTDSYDSNLRMTNNLQSPNTTVYTSEFQTPVPDAPSNGLGSPYEIASNSFVTPNTATSSSLNSPVEEFKKKTSARMASVSSQRASERSEDVHGRNSTNYTNEALENDNRI